MTLKQAKNALNDGKKIRHEFFLKYEYIKCIKGIIYDECGYNLGTISDYFKHKKTSAFYKNWEIYK